MVVAPVNAQVHGDIQDAGPFGVVHAEEEDVRPGAVRQVQPHRGPLDQDREQAVLGGPFQQSRMNPDGMLVGPADGRQVPGGGVDGDRGLLDDDGCGVEIGGDHAAQVRGGEPAASTEPPGGPAR